jgi:hypothetical protein
VPPESFGVAGAICPEGALALAAGQVIEDVGSGRLVQEESFPFSLNGRSGWQVTMRNIGNTSARFVVQAMCFRNAVYAPWRTRRPSVYRYAADRLMPYHVPDVGLDPSAHVTDQTW